MEKSKAAKTVAALRQLQEEFPQHYGVNRAIDEFLRGARPGTLMRLYDLVHGCDTKEAAIRSLEKMGARPNVAD